MGWCEDKRVKCENAVLFSTRCWCPGVLGKALSGYTVRCGQPATMDTPRFVIPRIGNVGMRRDVHVRRTLCHKRTYEYHFLDGRRYMMRTVNRIPIKTWRRLWRYYSSTPVIYRRCRRGLPIIFRRRGLHDDNDDEGRKQAELHATRIDASPPNPLEPATASKSGNKRARA